MDYYYVVDDELYHHGIKGQKWGVRRYQNPDGSLTDEGYQHWGLNRDGSNFTIRDRSGRKMWNPHVRSQAKKGFAVGTAAGTAAGIGLMAASAGAAPAAAAVMGMYAISAAMAGGSAGAAIGRIKGSVEVRKAKKIIREQLSKNGKVYVKDIKYKM